MIPALPTAALERLRRAAGGSVGGAVVLGSGLGVLLDAWEPELRIPTTELPGFPSSTVAGHAGTVALVRFGSAAPVLVYQGRSYDMVGFGVYAQVLRSIPLGAGADVGLMCRVGYMQYSADADAGDIWHGALPSVAVGLAVY